MKELPKGATETKPGLYVFRDVKSVFDNGGEPERIIPNHVIKTMETKRQTARGLFYAYVAAWLLWLVFKFVI
jgi:hypothetical protein